MPAIPAPEAGLVIAYSYLWRREHAVGQDEGRKDRPGVIVLAVERHGDRVPVVTVLPITHAAPTDPRTAVEIPQAVKRHLGLDDLRSWVVVDEGNEFAWPGYDLRTDQRSGEYAYGFLPPRFFRTIVEAFIALHPFGRDLISRD